MNKIDLLQIFLSVILIGVASFSYIHYVEAKQEYYDKVLEINKSLEDLKKNIALTENEYKNLREHLRIINKTANDFEIKSKYNEYKLNYIEEKINNIYDKLDLISEVNSKAYNEDVAGRYYIQSQDIEIYGTKVSNGRRALDVATHEIAHWIWNEKLSSAERNEYERYFQDGNNVTGYANKNVGEDFSETMRWSMKYEFDFSEIPENRKLFIQNNVIEHFPFELPHYDLSLND